VRLKLGVYCLVMVSVFSLRGGLLAHHSFSTEYDGAKTFKLTGTVSKVEWTNPHVRFYVDVAEGVKSETWNLELASPSALARNGWTSRTLKWATRLRWKATPPKSRRTAATRAR
jgi:hypothetical protein